MTQKQRAMDADSDESLRRRAELVAQGEIGFPVDLSDKDRPRFLAHLSDAMRLRLLQFLARQLADQLHGPKAKQGIDTDVRKHL